jgi:hypothetical protein
MRRPLRHRASEPDHLRPRALEVRQALLRLHKALIESERASYEKAMGKIPSPNHFLHLLTNDPWFAWLQPLSSLIVSIDELLDRDEPLTNDDVQAFVSQSGQLLAPTESARGFSGHYFQALQRDPSVVLAHADAAKALGAWKPAPD